MEPARNYNYLLIGDFINKAILFAVYPVLRNCTHPFFLFTQRVDQMSSIGFGG